MWKRILRRIVRGPNLLQECRARLERDPVDADLHFQYAKQCLWRGRTGIVYAELKTVQALGLTDAEVTAYNTSGKFCKSSRPSSS